MTVNKNPVCWHWHPPPPARLSLSLSLSSPHCPLSGKGGVVSRVFALRGLGGLGGLGVGGPMLFRCSSHVTCRPIVPSSADIMLTYVVVSGTPDASCIASYLLNAVEYSYLGCLADEPTFLQYPDLARPLGAPLGNATLKVCPPPIVCPPRSFVPLLVVPHCFPGPPTPVTPRVHPPTPLFAPPVGFPPGFQGWCVDPHL